MTDRSNEPASEVPAHAVDSTRGYSFPVFEILQELDPEYDNARRAMTGWVYTPVNPVIPAKYHEVIAGVVLASRFYPSMETHFRRALSEGVTMLEIIEALEAAAVPGGGPTLHFGLTALTKIHAEGKDAP